MKRQNLLLKLVGGLTIGMGFFWFYNPIKAQEFYHFPASFFNPVASFYQSEENPDVMGMLTMNEDFEIIAFLLRENATAKSLEQNEVTFLAPTDKAFQALPSDVRAKLSQPENLSKLIKYHTIGQAIQDEDIKRRQVDTLLGNSITITGFPVGNKYGVKLNDAIATDPLPASNGVIVPIDRVLIPPGF